MGGWRGGVLGSEAGVWGKCGAVGWEGAWVGGWGGSMELGSYVSMSIWRGYVCIKLPRRVVDMHNSVVDVSASQEHRSLQKQAMDAR